MTRKNSRDAGANRKRPTNLELRVLRAAAAGDWTRAMAPGHGTRIYSQAYARLKRMGLLGDSGMISILGAVALQESTKQ